MEKTFAADLARFDKLFADSDAIRTADDGYQWIDESKVSASLVGTYRRLVQYGYANGLI